MLSMLMILLVLVSVELVAATSEGKYPSMLRNSDHNIMIIVQFLLPFIDYGFVVGFNQKLHI
jgi:hypothetical protein